MKYFIETYGCEMNIAESSSVEQILLKRGWTKSECGETADCVIINTCSVRGSAETRILGRLGFYTGVKKVRMNDPFAKVKSDEMKIAAEFAQKNGKIPLTVIVMGCMAERLLKSLQKQWPVVDYTVGTFGKYMFPKIFENIENHGKPFPVVEEENYTFAKNSYEENAFSTFVPIMHGCNNFCTYCIVPYVRGREVSRPVEDILNELDFLKTKHVREITLLGQNVNAYRGENNTNFPKLLTAICDHLRKTNSTIEWIRFESSNPNDFDDELIQVIANEPMICRGFHIAVQHGNNQILKAMHRKYTREFYIELAKKLRDAMDDVQLVTDLMVGFPGETEEQFNDVLTLQDEVQFESAFMYYYNPREGTPAAIMDNQIPLEEKKCRLQKVINKQLTIENSVMSKRVGKTIKVLADIISKNDKNELLGKTEQNERVAFKGDPSLIGTFVNVRLDSLNGNTFKGTLIQ